MALYNKITYRQLNHPNIVYQDLLIVKMVQGMLLKVAGEVKILQGSFQSLKSVVIGM